MDQQSYVSCIKINGIPIISPLMTSNVRAEMNYYKQLAIATEKKLNILRITRQAVGDKCMGDIAKEYKAYKGELKRDSCDSTANDSFNSETESISVNVTPNAITAIDFPTKENRETTGKSDLECEATSVSEFAMETTIERLKSTSDEESSYQNDDLLIDSISTDAGTISTDLNQFLNETTSTQSNTAETTSEIWKPSVPNTLDIIPITVDGTRPEENTLSSQVIGSDRDTPKLIRQGSYILETPSPMLLAHIQTELANSNYVPSQGANAIKRKEWNIAQAKSEWENQIKNKDFIVLESSRIASGFRSRGNSISNCSNQKACKSVSCSKGRSPLGMRQPARSVDCIQTMLAKEFSCKSHSNNISNYGKRNGANSNGLVKNHGSCKWKTSKNLSILNLANKLGGSLGSLSNIGAQSYKQLEYKHSQNISTNKSSSSDCIKNNVTHNSKDSLKSVITSEKILAIFKEIRGTYENQMAELMTRQRKEQTNMQKEFERQQTLLLAQIKKTFPGISVPLLAETMPATGLDESVSLGEKLTGMSTSCVQQEENSNSLRNLQRENEIQSPKGNDYSSNTICPLDYINSLNGLCQATLHEATSSQFTQISNGCTNENLCKAEYLISSKDICIQRCSIDCRITNDKYNDDTERRHSNVSRQLFPLDSKTMHVPIPDNTLYMDRHVQAATIINAYARGYLVRRIMQTERVTALKSTYREALHCMLKLHVDAPLNLPELNFHERLQLQCDAASMNIVELFAQCPAERMKIIAHDREIKRSRAERPNSARSYSFATQRTLARKKLKEMGEHQTPKISKSYSSRIRCQTWASNTRDKRSPNILYQGIKRSTSSGTVRKPWR